MPNRFKRLVNIGRRKDNKKTLGDFYGFKYVDKIKLK